MGDDRTADEGLMVRVARDDREAMAVLLRRYATPLLTFIQRMIGDQHRAEELFQEVFLAVWAQRRRYQHPRPFRAWLFGIAVNKCRADFRKMDVACELLEEGDSAPASRDPSPLEAAIATETNTVVAQAVARLPHGQRTVLALRIWNGLSYAEIATIVGRTEATVRSHMFHALAAVRRSLEPRLRQAD